MTPAFAWHSEGGAIFKNGSHKPLDCYNLKEMLLTETFGNNYCNLKKSQE